MFLDNVKHCAGLTAIVALIIAAEPYKSNCLFQTWVPYSLENPSVSTLEHGVHNTERASVFQSTAESCKSVLSISSSAFPRWLSFSCRLDWQISLFCSPWSPLPNTVEQQKRHLQVNVVQSWFLVKLRNIKYACKLLLESNSVSRSLSQKLYLLY